MRLVALLLEPTAEEDIARTSPPKLISHFKEQSAALRDLAEPRAVVHTPKMGGSS